MNTIIDAHAHCGIIDRSMPQSFEDYRSHNGGYHAFVEHGVWDKANIYADTALASTHEIKDYIENFGYDWSMRYSPLQIYKEAIVSLPGHPQSNNLEIELQR